MAILFISQSLDGEEWRRIVTPLLPDVDFRVWPDVGPTEEVEMVVAWNAPPGAFEGLINLKAIFWLGAGVDQLLRDPALPWRVPIVRLVDPSLTRQMTAYVLLGVLRHHRLAAAYEAQQRAARWASLPRPDPAHCRVGIMGLGALGTDAARKLLSLGFEVSGWSRTPKRLEGVKTHHGRERLKPFLGECDVVVCLLPLTPETRDILDAEAFAAMKKGAYLVNAARGEHVVEEDLLEGLESGQISGATLDVFGTEPLPPDHPFWRHPRVTVTPHTAADTLAHAVAPQVVENYRRMKRGEALPNLVDLDRGY